MSDAGINWNDLQVLTEAGINWSDIDVLSDSGINWSNIGELAAAGINWSDIDVLSDWDVREGIKEVNNWPTIPQLFVKGTFIGGCDIAMELHRSGELKNLLADAQP